MSENKMMGPNVEALSVTQACLSDLDVALNSVHETAIEVSRRCNVAKELSLPPKPTSPSTIDEKDLSGDSELVTTIKTFTARVKGTRAELIELLDRLQL